MRFEIWGESVGLPSGRFNHEPVIPYNTHLDRPEVRPDIERALENIRHLLSSVTAIDSRYGVTRISVVDEGTTTLRGTQIFQKSYDRLKNRIRKDQKGKSTMKTTRWALHDAKQFKDAISRLTAFVDGLVQVTTTLGLLEQRYEALRLHEEINTITNEEDLELLVEATSRHSASINKTVSDTASQRLVTVSASIRSHRSDTSTFSFHTANTKPSERSGRRSEPAKSHHPSVALDSVLESDNEDSESGGGSPDIPGHTTNASASPIGNTRSCAECEDSQLACSTVERTVSCVNCTQSMKQCSFDVRGGVSLSSEPDPSSASIPQHERLLAEAAARSRAPPRELSFKAGDAHHGERLTNIKNNDLDYWIDHSAGMVLQAHRGNSATKRMFHELRIIRQGHVPFISATPVEDNLGKILASVEGPPETPYEGGIFWLLVLVSQKTPPGPPIIRFHTKIYHPNINPTTGVLCADYQQKWSPSKVPSSLQTHFAESSALWSQRMSPDMWSLSALLIAICGLLASPNASDPLIPEIAQKYVEDPEGYFEAAKLWTQRYASNPEKPDEVTLRFPEESEEHLRIEDLVYVSPMDCDADGKDRLLSHQTRMRLKYDSKFIPLFTTPLYKFADFRVSTSTDDVFNKDHSSKYDSQETAKSAVRAFLFHDAGRIRPLQTTGEHISKIEQFRLLREIRYEIEKRLYREAPFHKSPPVSMKKATLESWITQIASEQTELNKSPLHRNGYLSLITESFHGDSPSPTPKASEADARKHRIPPGYSLKHWDPTQDPIFVLGSVFDARSLGKWIYDWTVFRHGPSTPITDIATDLQSLLLQLADKLRQSDDAMARIRLEENREMVEDFIESGARLIEKLNKLLKASSKPMLKAYKADPIPQLGKDAGVEFVDTFFGREGQLEATEKFMSSVRLWSLRWDANCEDICRRPEQLDNADDNLEKPAQIRISFGLEDISELPTNISSSSTSSRNGKQDASRKRHDPLPSRYSVRRDDYPHATIGTPPSRYSAIHAREPPHLEHVYSVKASTRATRFRYVDARARDAYILDHSYDSKAYWVGGTTYATPNPRQTRFAGYGPFKQHENYYDLPNPGFTPSGRPATTRRELNQPYSIPPDTWHSKSSEKIILRK